MISEITAGLNEEEQNGFSAYIANRFENCVEAAEPDTDFLKVWESIINYAGLFGAANAINKKVCPERPVEFNSPDTIEIKLYGSFAGKIPIIYVRDTADFEQLVTNVAYKGVRPDGLEKTGASFISGKTTRFMILSVPIRYADSSMSSSESSAMTGLLKQWRISGSAMTRANWICRAERRGIPDKH